MENRDKMIERIRHMIEMQSVDAHAFEGEISNAAALVQRLMDKYNITLAEVELSGNKEFEQKFDGKESTTEVGGIQQWHWLLAAAIGRITQTKQYSSTRYTQGKRAGKKGRHGQENRQRQAYKVICFYGKDDNVAIATILFDQWVITIHKMALTATREYTEELERHLSEEYGKKIDLRRKGGSQYRELGVDLEDTPRVFLDSWLKGCTIAINHKLEEQEESRSKKTSTALMVIQSKLDVAYEQFTSKGFSTAKAHGSRRTNVAGYVAGSVAGNSISIGSKELENG